MERAQDRIRYPDWPYVQTHPDRLAVAALLHGVEPAPPSTARVLELGCGAGINLINIAYASPGVTALGVDLAVGPIADAQADVRALGLTNVEFVAGDAGALELDGSYDYVIAHGLYSWVDRDVQDAVMGVIGRALAPNGVALMSYNAHPGNHVRTALREAGLWFGGPEILTELAELRARPDGDAWARMLDLLLRPLMRSGPAFIAHDILNDDWSPVWFADFVAHARAHGMDWMGEAESKDLRAIDAPGGSLETLEAFAAGDPIAFQQYLDIFTFQRFRSSLLCRAERAPRREIDPEVVERLRWESPDGVAEGPAAALLDGFRRGELTPFLEAPRYAQEPPERPRASAVARHQAARGETQIAGLDHSVVSLEAEPARILLSLLDGTRDREAIRRDFEAAARIPLPPAVLEAQLGTLTEMALLHSSGSPSQ